MFKSSGELSALLSVLARKHVSSSVTGARRTSEFERLLRDREMGYGKEKRKTGFYPKDCIELFFGNPLCFSTLRIGTSTVLSHTYGIFLLNHAVSNV